MGSSFGCIRQRSTDLNRRHGCRKHAGNIEELGRTITTETEWEGGRNLKDGSATRRRGSKFYMNVHFFDFGVLLKGKELQKGRKKRSDQF